MSLTPINLIGPTPPTESTGVRLLELTTALNGVIATARAVQTPPTHIPQIRGARFTTTLFLMVSVLRDWSTLLQEVVGGAEELASTLEGVPRQVAETIRETANFLEGYDDTCPIGFMVSHYYFGHDAEDAPNRLCHERFQYRENDLATTMAIYAGLHLGLLGINHEPFAPPVDPFRILCCPETPYAERERRARREPLVHTPQKRIGHSPTAFGFGAHFAAQVYANHSHPGDLLASGDYAPADFSNGSGGYQLQGTWNWQLWDAREVKGPS